MPKILDISVNRILSKRRCTLETSTKVQVVSTARELTMHDKNGTTANTGSIWAWHLDRTYSKTHYAHGDGANVSEERQGGEFT